MEIKLFRKANKYSLSIEIHPYNAGQMVKLEDKYWRFHLIWMMAQCADTLHLFTLRGIPSKYPNIRTCFAHGCMLGIANYGRRLQGYDGRPDLFIDTESPRDYLSHKNYLFFQLSQ